MQERLANLLEQWLPKFLINASKDALTYAGVDMRPGRWLMFSLVNSFLAGVMIALMVRGFIGDLNWIYILLLPIIFGAASMGVFHNVLIYYGMRRAIQIESMLPDALQLIAANIRADIPIHKALLLAARPEFGLLAQEIEKTGNDILAGKSTSMAFNDMSTRVRSPLVSRITTLMDEGLRSGHDVAGMMDQVAYDIRAFKILDDEAKANIGSYVLFIVMAVLFVAPVLYSISISFIDLSTQVRETLNVGELVEGAALSSSSSLVGLVSGGAGIDIDTLVWFAGLNLAVSAGIAAVLVSVLQTGEVLGKMPYTLVFIIVAEVLFIVSITTLRVVLGGFFTM